MKFNFLTEGRRKSDRHQANQRARDTFLGQDAETIRAVGWRKRAQYIMADMGIPDEKQGTIMAALNKVEKKRGATWLNAQPSDALRGTFIQFLNDFKKKDQGLLSLHHARPGVSGIYHMSGAGVGRSGLEREQSVRQTAADARRADDIRRGIDRDPTGVEPEHTAGALPSSKQLRTNIAHITTSTLNQDELRYHSHPDVRKLFSAVDPRKPEGDKDDAVVWTADNKPYYIFGQLTKVLKRDENAPKNEYNLMFPRALNHTNNQRQIDVDNLGTYDNETKWRRVMDSQDLIKLPYPRGHVDAGKEVVLTGSLDAVILKAQELAWKSALIFYDTWKKYEGNKEEADRLRARYTIPGGEGALPMPEDRKKLHAKLFWRAEIYKSQLLGRESSNFRITDPKEREKYREKLARMGDSYTWYLWLLASEFQYGVRLPHRKEILKDQKPMTTKKAVQGKPTQWAIQPVGREPVTSWDTRAIQRSGIMGGDIVRFERELKASPYKLKNQGIKAVRQLWIPLVGNLKKRWGLDVHPAAISDYIQKAERFEKAENIVGDMGGSMHPRNEIEVPQFIFEAGKPRRRFSLIPAIGYLQYFDSPHHPGERLVHGKPKLQPSIKAADPLTPPLRRTLPGGQKAYLQPMSKTFHYDPDARQAEVNKIAANLADKLLKQKEMDRKAAENLTFRIRQRKSLSYPSTKKRWTTERPWHAPRKREGFAPAPFAHLKFNDVTGTLPPSVMFKRPEAQPFVAKMDTRGKWRDRDIWHTADPEKIVKTTATGARVHVLSQTNPRKRFSIKSVGPAVRVKTPKSIVPPEVMPPVRQHMPVPWPVYWTKMKERLAAKPRYIDGERVGVEELEKLEPKVRQDYLDMVDDFIIKARREGAVVIDHHDRVLHSSKDVQFS